MQREGCAKLPLKPCGSTLVPGALGPIHGTEVAPLTSLVTPEEPLQSLFRFTRSGRPIVDHRTRRIPQQMHAIGGALLLERNA
jgi:hypothetical protein